MFVCARTRCMHHKLGPFMLRGLHLILDCLMGQLLGWQFDIYSRKRDERTRMLLHQKHPALQAVNRNALTCAADLFEAVPLGPGTAIQAQPCLKCLHTPEATNMFAGCQLQSDSGGPA